jgi:tetratricopeptide (TPR) repeat protein
MSRWLTAGLICLLGAGFTATAQQQPAEQKEQREQIPPEEDESAKPKEYSFNPLAAEKELRVGNYYFHKGSYGAAAQRFREATRWNNNFAEAYVRLGDAEEKRKNWKAAREAYEKYLQLAGEEDKRNGEIRKEVRKKVARLPKDKT